MNDKRIEVEFGATVGELQAKTASAVSTIGGFAGAVQAAAIQGGGAWTGLANIFEQQGGKIGGAIGLLGTGLMGIGAILGAGMFSKMVIGNLEAAASLHDLAQSSGITVEALSALSSIGRTSDTSIQTIAAASNKLAMNLSSASEESKGAAAALRALGIDFNTFQAMSPEARMQAVAQSMAGFADGKQGAQLLPFLNDLADAGELHAKITTEQADAADEFTDNLTKLSGAGSAWKKTLSLAMAPALADVSRAVVDLWGKTGGLKEQINKLSQDGTIDQWARNGVTAVTYLVDVVVVLKRAFETVGSTIGAALAQSSAMLSGLVDAYNKVTTGDFGGAVDALKGAYGQMTVVGQEWLAEQKDLWAQATAGAQIRDAMAKGGPAQKVDKQKLKFDNSKEGGDGKSKADKSRMPQFEAELEAARNVATQLDAIHGMSKEQELKYWQEVAARNVLTNAEALAVAKKTSEAKIAILREQAQQGAQLEKIGIEASRDAALAKVDQQAQASQQLAAQGEMTAGQLLAQEQQFEDRRYNIKLSSLQQMAALLDPDRDPVQLAQTLAQIEQLEQQHQMRIGQIRGQAAQQSAEEQSAIWSDLGLRMSSLWDQGVNAMMNGTLRWSGVVKAVGMQLGGWFAGIAKDMAKHWLMAEQAKTGATLTGTASRLATEAWAAIKSTAIWAASAAKNIMLSAWQAMAGAWAAISSIPVIGPVLAPVVAAGVFAGVVGLARNVASAEGGYDIPAGVNPLTQLHEREMVLPAKHADTIRALGEGGASGAGGDTYHLNVSAVDAQGVKRLLIDNPAALAAGMRNARRNGHFSGAA